MQKAEAIPSSTAILPNCTVITRFCLPQIGKYRLMIIGSCFWVLNLDPEYNCLPQEEKSGQTVMIGSIRRLVLVLQQNNRNITDGIFENMKKTTREVRVKADEI